MNISSSARLCYQLSEIDGFGLKLFHKLTLQFGSIECWQNISPSQLISANVKPQLAERICSILEANNSGLSDDLAAWLDGEGCSLISYFDDAYPETLRHTHLAPALLYCRGNISLLARPSLAVVGSRKPSRTHESLAQEYSYGAAKQGWNVVSGLALGIDTAAHMGALAAGGATIAVMATGIDRCYPAKNSALHQEICESGLVITEMPLGSPPLRPHFPRRNRIVSGLSAGVLVVEAGLKSGSLITARYALEQNREVYAVPGSPSSLSSQGCNHLIRQGARLISSTEELISDLNELGGAQSEVLPSVCDASSLAKRSNIPENASEEERQLLLCLEEGKATFDELLARCSLGFDVLSDTLLQLEISGAITMSAGGYECLS